MMCLKTNKGQASIVFPPFLYELCSQGNQEADWDVSLYGIPKLTNEEKRI